jgi:hypothetical protein
MVRAHHEGDRLRGRALEAAIGVPGGWDTYLAMWAEEPVVYPHIRLQATPEDIIAARDGTLPRSRLIEDEHPKLRWERIAARAGTTQERARELYERIRGPGSAKKSYTGKGRRFPDMD